MHRNREFRDIQCSPIMNICKTPTKISPCNVFFVWRGEDHICPSVSLGSRARRNIVRACSPSRRPFAAPVLANIFLYRSFSAGPNGGSRFPPKTGVPGVCCGVVGGAGVGIVTCTPSNVGNGGPATNRQQSPPLTRKWGQGTSRRHFRSRMFALLSMGNESKCNRPSLLGQKPLIIRICDPPYLNRTCR